jgi:hypothetical protein
MASRPGKNCGGKLSSLRRPDFAEAVISLLWKIVVFFRSKYLAIALMATIAVVILGATIFLKPYIAQQSVFTSLWFNALLVLLVVNTAFCFFSRLGGRTWDLAFTGVVVFHLSFVMLFLAVAYDRLFFFQGTVRLTEGETLSLSDRASYDNPLWGRFFIPARTLKGNITLHRIEPNHIVDGRNKGAACELEIGTGPADVVRGFTYVTDHLDYNGFRFFRDQGGFSPCLSLYDETGNDIYGACFSLQSIRQQDGKFRYTTGSPHGPEPILFPQSPVQPLFYLLTEYFPIPKNERKGNVRFTVMPLEGNHRSLPRPEFEGQTSLDEKIRIGKHSLALREIRYWVNLEVRYNPGLPLILASMWLGLGGIIVTAFAKLIRKK